MEISHSVVSQPSITNQSFDSNFIAIYWKQDNVVESYKIQYNFTIKQCADEMDAQVTNYYESNEIILARNNYTIHNETSMRVEENSVYNISVIAVNSDVSSPAAIIMNATKEAGIILLSTSTYLCNTNFKCL